MDNFYLKKVKIIFVTHIDCVVVYNLCIVIKINAIHLACVLCVAKIMFLRYS